MSLGDQIRAARIEAGLSQSALGRLAEMDQSDISSIEKGARNPGAGVLGRISEALGVDFEQDPISQVVHETRREMNEEGQFSTDEPPKAKKTASTAKKSGPRHAKSTGGIPLVVQLEFPYQILSNATANRLPQTSAMLAAQAGPCAAAWDNFLLRYPALREKIESGMIAGDIIALIMAHLPIIQAAREETQRLAEQQAWDAGSASPAAA